MEELILYWWKKEEREIVLHMTQIQHQNETKMKWFPNLTTNICYSTGEEQKF